MTESDLCSLSLPELRAMTFREGQTADELATLMRHWSSPARDLRAWHYVDAMLRSWVLLAANPAWNEYLPLARLFYQDPELEVDVRGEFDTYLRARYEGRPALVIPRDVARGSVQCVVHGRNLKDCPEVGLLASHGYHVGKNGRPLNERRRILDYIMTSVLPDKPSRAEVQRYGAPYSEHRLRQVVQVIDTFRISPGIEQAKKRAVAIADWSRDLEYLRNNYYLGWYDFIWPEHVLAA